MLYFLLYYLLTEKKLFLIVDLTIWLKSKLSWHCLYTFFTNFFFSNFFRFILVNNLLKYCCQLSRKRSPRRFGSWSCPWTTSSSTSQAHFCITNKSPIFFFHWYILQPLTKIVFPSIVTDYIFWYLLLTISDFKIIIFYPPSPIFQKTTNWYLLSMFSSRLKYAKKFMFKKNHNIFLMFFVSTYMAFP